MIQFVFERLTLAAEEENRGWGVWRKESTSVIWLLQCYS